MRTIRTVLGSMVVLLAVSGCSVQTEGGGGDGEPGSQWSALERKAHEARGLTEDVTWRLGVESPEVAVVEGAGIQATARGIVIGEDLVRDHSRECLAEILIMTAGATYDQRTAFVDVVLGGMVDMGSISIETYDTLIVSEMRVALVWSALGAWWIDADPASPELADWLEGFEGGHSAEWAMSIEELVIGVDDVAAEGWLDGDAWFMEGEEEIGWDEGWDEEDAEDFDGEWDDDWGDDWDDDADWDEEADWDGDDEEDGDVDDEDDDGYDDEDDDGYDDEEDDGYDDEEDDG